MPPLSPSLRTLLLLTLFLTSASAADPPLPRDNTRVASVPASCADAHGDMAGAVLRLPVIPHQAPGGNPLLPAGRGTVSGAERITRAVGKPGSLDVRSRSLSPGIRFTENRGQIADTEGQPCPDIRYVADAGGALVYFTANGVSTVFSREEEEKSRISEATGLPIQEPGDKRREPSRFALYRMEMLFEGANPDARLRAENELEGYANFYLSHCPDGITHVRSFGTLVYENLWDHIDVVYTASQKQLKYEFIVHPGGDPSHIRLRYEGALSVRKHDAGDLTIHTPLGSIEEHAPYSFQDGTVVESEFDVDGDVVRFEIGAYDRRQPLTIDPWATYCGGSDYDCLTHSACDANGNIVVAGGTRSTNFPVMNAFQSTLADAEDAVITMYNAAGVIQWSTFYGGSSMEGGLDSYAGLAIDDAGKPVFCCTTGSSDFPVTAGAFQTTKLGYSCGALVKFASDGMREWATFCGSTRDTYFADLATDGNNDIIVVGTTNGGDYPVLNALQPTFAGGVYDVVVTKFSSNGLLLWSTFLGGTQHEGGGGAVILSDNSVVITGYTVSDDFPVSGAFQGSLSGGGDAFLTRMNSSGGLVWSTYFGGSLSDEGWSVCRDGSDDIYMAGATGGANFPIANALQPSYGGGNNDGFIAKFSSGGNRIWSTFFGGSDHEDRVHSVACHSGVAVYVCGNTKSANFPVLNAFQPVMHSVDDGYCAGISPGGALQWSTYYGGNDSDELFDVCVGQNGDAVCVGRTRSTNLWTQNAQQSSYGGGSYDGMIVTLSAVVYYPVSAPTDLTASALNASTVLLNWKDNSDSEMSFVIEHRIGAGSWTQSPSAPQDATSAVITGLQPSTSYTFRVKGVNPSYESGWSNTATAVTMDFIAPSNLFATSSSSDLISLSWTDNSTGEEGFIVEMMQGTPPWNVADTVASDATQYMVPGLQPATSYSFRVRAFDGSLLSVYSNVASATTLQFLPPPANLSATLLTANSAQLRWEDRATGETGFEIEERIGTGGWTLAATTAENATEHLLTSLTADVEYSFRVRAVGNGYASSWSNEVSLSTRTVPNAPHGLTAQAVSYRAIDLTWERGSTNETGFEIERRDGAGAWAQAHTVDAGVITQRDDNLNSSTTYTYRVRAVNGLGASAWSNEASAATQAPPVPARPIGFAAVATGSASIRLTWVAPSPQYQSGFEIQESLTGNEMDFTRIAPDAAANALSYDRTGLQPLTTYHFRIRAVNISGSSDWSNIVSATTSQADPNLPGTPFGVQATAISQTEIRITWDMPASSKEDGFEVEQSSVSGTDGFALLGTKPAQGAREHTDAGLQPGATYWYRVRAFNTYGQSQYSNVASATTQREPLTQELLDAMQAKAALYSALEGLIAAGDAEMAVLRTIFGDYPRGYDESPARALITNWQTAYPADQGMAADAMARYTFFEQALRSVYHDAQFTPPVEGAWEISREASGAPAMLTKDICALALAWVSERGALGTENPYVDAAMEDLLLPVSDGAETLLALMGANDGHAVGNFVEEAMREKGEVAGLNARSLLSVLEYWQERMAGRYYVPATQPAIAAFADKCAQLDIGGTRQSAIAKRDGSVLAVRDRGNALSLGYTPYAGVCTGLDAAYAIGQTPAPTVEIFLQRLTQLRPRLVDGMYRAITDADIPIERFLYLTSQEDIPGLDPLPFSLMKSGDAIYHPEIGGAPPPGAGFPGTARTSAPPGGRGPVRIGAPVAASDPAIESDRTALIVLREKIVAADAAYAAAQYDALRASGREMTAALVRIERPLFGITPADMYQQTALHDSYYGTLARGNLLKTRRAVLSVALADYALTPTSQKQANLVAEIDSIIGPLDGVIAALEDLTSGQAGTMITLPVLTLGSADIVRDEAAGPTRCRLRFTVANVGGATAAAPQTNLTILTEGAAVLGATSFTFADLAIAATTGDSIALDIPDGTLSITLSAQLQSGGRMFTDRRTLAVPRSTTAVESATVLPSTCLLHQNHPNPFRPVTTLSFTLPRETAVTLIVTDVLGREVARLCNGEHRSAGTHAVTFDGRTLPAGMYLYRLEAMGMVLSRKMVLLR